MIELSQEQLDTLRGIEFQATDLRQHVVGHLAHLGLIWTDWSDYGWKLSDEGEKYL